MTILGMFNLKSGIYIDQQMSIYFTSDKSTIIPNDYDGLTQNIVEF